MTTDLEQLLRKGLREHADAVPVTVPPVPMVVVPRKRRGFLAPVLAAVIVVAVVLLIPRLTPPPPTPSGDTAAGPGIPSELAGFSFLTADLSRAPVDRAVAVYRQQYEPLEDWAAYETHVLSADGDRYRRVGALRDLGPDPGTDLTDPVWLLAPDGRQLAFRMFGDLSLLNIGTGALTRHTLGDLDHIKLMGWSPDSVWVAYTFIGAKTLHLFNSRSAESVTVQGLRDVEAAAFSPDGKLLTVQTPGQLHFVDVRSRTQTRSLPLADRSLQLVNAVAWSPDGSLLAMHGMKEYPSRTGVIRSPEAIRFIDATTGQFVGQTYTRDYTRQYADMLAWRTGRSILVWFGHGLVEVPVEGGPESTLMTFSPDNLTHMQLAPGLVVDATIRDPGEADRGPWPDWFRILIIVALVLTVPPVVALTWVLRRRRRRRPATA